MWEGREGLVFTVVLTSLQVGKERMERGSLKN